MDRIERGYTTLKNYHICSFLHTIIVNIWLPSHACFSARQQISNIVSRDLANRRRSTYLRSTLRFHGLNQVFQHNNNEVTHKATNKQTATKEC